MYFSVLSYRFFRDNQLTNRRKKKAHFLLFELVMSDNINERGSTSSDIAEVEIVSDEHELDDLRLRFISNYLTIAFGTTPVAFKKGVPLIFQSICQTCLSSSYS